MKTSENKHDEFEELVLELDMARIIFAEEEEEEEEEEEARIIVSMKDITERRKTEEVLRQTHESAEEAGRLQQWMLQTQLTRARPYLEVCFHPQHQAGGDFLNTFQVGDDRFLILIGDVSGHNLAAGFLTSYFQGVARAMMQNHQPPHELLDFINHLLFADWNRARPEKVSPPAISMSLGVILLDLKAQTVHVINQGLPPPLYADGDGVIQRELIGSNPLGWSRDRFPHESRFAIGKGATLHIWTDGLEVFASENQVDPAAAAYHLLQADPPERTTLFQSLDDDVLVAHIDLSSDHQHSPGWHPLIQETLDGSRGRDIDRLQSGWERSLTFALRDGIAKRLDGVLLGLREATRNALKHGCAQDPAKFCAIQAAYQPVTRRLRCRVQDPGKGIDFPAVCAEMKKNPLTERHFGLVLMEKTADRIAVDRTTGTVTMDFVL